MSHCDHTYHPAGVRTTTTTTATPLRQHGEAHCSVVPALALIMSLVHGLCITIIYYQPEVQLKDVATHVIGTKEPDLPLTQSTTSNI